MVGHALGMALVVGHQQHSALAGNAFEQFQQQIGVVVLQVGSGLIAHQQQGLGSGFAQNGYRTLVHRRQLHRCLRQQRFDIGKAHAVQIGLAPGTAVQTGEQMGLRQQLAERILHA